MKFVRKRTGLKACQLKCHRPHPHGQIRAVMFERVQKCGTVELEHEQEEEVLREERKAVGCVWRVNRRVRGREAAAGRDGEEGEGCQQKQLKSFSNTHPWLGLYEVQWSSACPSVFATVCV